MKTTIKLSSARSIVIQPARAGGVAFSLHVLGVPLGSFDLSNASARYAGNKTIAASDKGETSEIHFDDGRILDILPAEVGKGAQLHLKGLGFIDLTPDQCGVLNVGIDCAINPVVAAKHAAPAAA